MAFALRFRDVVLLLIFCLNLARAENMEEANGHVDGGEGWRKVIIPLVHMDMTIAEGSLFIQGLAEKAGAVDRGFRGIEIEDSLVENQTRRIKLELNNVPLDKLLDFVATQIGGVWGSMDGKVRIARYAPPAEYEFSVGPKLLLGLGIEDRPKVNKADLVRALNALGTDLLPREVEFDGEAVKVVASREKVAYVMAVVLVISKGNRIIKTQ